MTLQKKVVSLQQAHKSGSSRFREPAIRGLRRRSRTGYEHMLKRYKSQD